MGQIQTHAQIRIITVIILINCVFDKIAYVSSQSDYPIEDYYSENFNNYYDNSPVTSYAPAELKGTPGARGVVQPVQLPQRNTDQYSSNYEDFPYYETENSGYGLNYGNNNIQSASVLGANSPKYSNSSSSSHQPNVAASGLLSVDDNFPKENLPFDPLLTKFNTVNQAQPFKHPFQNSQGHGDDELTLGYFDKGVVDKKGIFTVIASTIAIYLLVVLLIKTPKEIFEPKCKDWGWDGFPEYSFHAEPRLVPAIPVDPKMQLEFLRLFRGNNKKKNDKKKDKDESDSSSSEENNSFEMQYSAEIDYIAQMCPKDAFFYGLSPDHIEAYTALQRMFVAQSSPAEVLSLARALVHHPKINPRVWYLGILAAAHERPDMNGYAMAHPLDAIPDNFVPAHLIEYWDMDEYDNYRALNGTGLGRQKGDNKYNSYFNKFKGKGKQKGKKGKKGKEKKECIKLDGTIGVVNGIENKLWYWREDLMINQHHMYWHQAYPVNATRHPDRRAELFFFMHRNMLARYNAERLSNGLDRTYELQIEYGTILLEGYNSYLADVNARQYWTPRVPLVPLADAIHEHDPNFARNVIIKEIQDLYWKFVKAIKEGKLVTPGGYLAIDHHRGITPLANTVEASQLSINPLYYNAFGLHNLGHLMIALASDYDYTKKLPPGIMCDAAVSMRDPTFYTYHTVIDNLFEKYKEMLAPYKPIGGEFPLVWKGVEIIDVELIPVGDGPANELRTFFSKQKFPLAPGVDGSVDKGDEAKICAVHLDHEPFQFKIIVDRKPCAKSKTEKATVRIFMAPRYDEKGDRLPLVEQRRLMFQLDGFPVHLKIGRNVITRRSQDNSLTHPWTKSLKEYEQGPDPTGNADYCGCGWPSHMLLPKGNKEGMSFDLFVMVTNYDEDFVVDNPRDLEMPETCTSPYIFCGIPRRLYPDARPMGYPFDRTPYKVPVHNCGHGQGLSSILCKFLPAKHYRPVATLEEYVSLAPNMAAISFGIQHTDKLFKKPKGAKG